MKKYIFLISLLCFIACNKESVYYPHEVEGKTTVLTSDSVQFNFSFDCGYVTIHRSHSKVMDQEVIDCISNTAKDIAKCYTAFEIDYYDVGYVEEVLALAKDTFDTENKLLMSLDINMPQ